MECPGFVTHIAFSPSKIRTGQLATDVIVFVVGGGNYVEYQNIHDYGKSKGMQRIIYGTTEMVSPKNFVEQVRIRWHSFAKALALFLSESISAYSSGTTTNLIRHGGPFLRLVRK